MTDPTADDLLAEVDIRTTGGTGRWTGDYKLKMSDPELARRLAGEVRALRETVDQWSARWQEQYERAERAETAEIETRGRLAVARGPASDDRYTTALTGVANDFAKAGIERWYTGFEVAMTLRAVLADADRTGDDQP